MGIENERRLSEATVASAPRLGALAYDRSALKPGIVHLGLGAFHRAHEAVYTHRTLEGLPPAESSKWGIVGVSMRSASTGAALNPQDGLYTVHERSTGAKPNVFLVGCLLRCMVAPHDPPALLELLGSADVRIVSLTVTEKGYCYDAGTRALDLAHPDIVHDLDPQHAHAPRSAIGLIVLALRARRAAGVPPFTCLSCDNLSENGRTLGKLCAAFAAALEPSPALARWIESEVSFPNTVVDCIVPAVAPGAVEAACGADGPLAGLRDEGLVICEPYRQWVIEDSFGPLGHPPWERAGAQLCDDARPHESLKLRVLNASHSVLAYLGALCGFETIVEAIEEPALAKISAALLELDVIPALEPPKGVDVREYASRARARFRNGFLKHRTEQVAMDGSQKLPQRLLESARALIALRAGQAPALTVLPLAVAGWLVYVTRLDDKGGAIAVSDPLAAKFKAIATSKPRTAEGIAGAMLGLHEVFGTDGLATDAPNFVEPVTEHVRELQAAGAPADVLAYCRAFAARLPAVTLD
jgi:fructuronate reductase